MFSYFAITCQKLTISQAFSYIKISWHGFCLYIGGACEILEILRQSACKICDWSYVKTGLCNQSGTITDDRIFIEKLATFFKKSKCGTSRAVPVFEKNIMERVRLCRIAF